MSKRGRPTECHISDDQLEYLSYLYDIRVDKYNTLANVAKKHYGINCTRYYLKTRLIDYRASKQEKNGE